MIRPLQKRISKTGESQRQAGRLSHKSYWRGLMSLSWGGVGVPADAVGVVVDEEGAAVGASVLV
jgi:hypothetical protein